ncbi:MAG TPA: hypothetical protein VFE94_01380 [Candidatus Paceibacterota bacterium]|nr:hypothetical protein [Candidatus Paceibacterota bacterium]
MQKRDLFIIFFLGLTLVMVIWVASMFVQTKQEDERAQQETQPRSEILKKANTDNQFTPEELEARREALKESGAGQQLTPEELEGRKTMLKNQN